ncbi:methyltransferase domain-containing protein [Marinobacter sp. X15-166B]|uniref:methyltransferase domain-containing protein n=1 Tax=Marinobacter sp. X15-166B TaxID=1897620 RepID=UPI00085BD9D9|nr:methyltransferase domain-containing protein [Marinobacter sp. X15-166B]OEY67328.1 hypothetical protein BG841_13340 [Marinobacter sp. X15-166B]
MAIKASDNEVAAARAYQQLHVPALFQQFAPVMAAAAGIQPGQRVLDVACGTGVLAREVATQVGDDGVVAGLDAAPGMLAVARQLAPSIDWHQGLAESLPYEDHAFDAVVCQFGLMFFQDRLAAIAEMLRVAAPGGRLAVGVWDSLEHSQAYPDAVALLERQAGQAAADALRAPFVMGDQHQLAKLFQDAGAVSVDITTHHGTARFPSIRAMVEADLRGWLPVMGVNLTEQQIAIILTEAETVLNRFVTAGGTVAFDAPAHIVTARAP